VARTGDIFEMVDGSTYEVTKSAADANGQFVEMMFTFPPGSVAPPPHTHPGLTEEYEVVEGELDVMVAGKWRTVAAGETASVPPDTDHTFKNRSGAVVRARNIHRPPARFEDYIEHICRLLDARGITSKRDPRVPVYLAMVMLEYPDTLAPSRAAMRFAMRAAAALGRMFRMRTS